MLRIDQLEMRLDWSCRPSSWKRTAASLPAVAGKTWTNDELSRHFTTRGVQHATHARLGRDFDEPKRIKEVATAAFILSVSGNATDDPGATLFLPSSPPVATSLRYRAIRHRNQRRHSQSAPRTSPEHHAA
mmetsp:Transcript_28928/g.84020  ORF Transcript_28928/g.84020 Transcript_28928/m.84020 type:complete len:131 (-) Transcript_28928:101-493(-)